jgi:tetratricopeptide (TPR) repeat protein
MNQRIAGLRWLLSLAMISLLPISAAAAAAPDVDEARKEFLSGNYGRCITLAETALKENDDREYWQLLLSEALWTTGRYPEARTVITNAVANESWRLRLRWQARKILQSNGQPDAAGEMVEDILRRVSSEPRSYQDAPSLVVFGQAALLRGADPKRVLDKIFETARKANPKMREVHLASGELALEKHDFALAAKKFQEGLKQLPDDPDLLFGLAQAYAPSDQALMIDSLEAALARNSNHVGSLLLLAEHNIDAEDYAEAAKLLDRIKNVNPWHPEAWAYRAVLAHLQNQPQAEKTARRTALKFWPANPRVDHLIGLKLSQKYRFTEGAACQRQALEYDPDYLPAKAQLAQDLLRLGEEAEGWSLANEVQKQDGYDVAAFNLVTLHETMDKFATLTNRDFVVRMSRHEADVYGQRVLELLGQARSNLCAKYGLEVKRPTIIEVFPEQKDFAVRTFGMPGNPGYLGVCFGTVVTANSPAANPGHPVNWQAVLWHEFCHVVTLQSTRNKMPRWLSEGISVYEEIQANPTWGQHMTPRYREMILGDELTPVSELSAAFLTPPSEEHLQFAYYESSLVVEFLVQRFDPDKLKAILRDLGEGVEINQAIEKHTAPMAKIEKEFAAFARERAEKLAPGLDWQKPTFLARFSEKRPAGKSRSRTAGPVRTNADYFINRYGIATNSGANTLVEWIAVHPTNFYALTDRAGRLIEQKKFPEAKEPLQKLVELFPAQTGGDSAYAMLAIVHRALGETNAERQVLTQLAEKDDAATDAYQRLMELGTAAQDWPSVAQNAQRYLAVNPLVPAPYRFLAQASEHGGEPQSAMIAYRALLQLDPPDPAETHFRLAQLLDRAGDPAARRHVLQALEEAPRYRAALQLLLDINKKSPQAKTNAGEKTAVGIP